MGDPARKSASDDHEADPLEHGDEWEEEIHRRIKDAEEGRGESIPWEDVKAEIDAKLAAIAQARTTTSRR
jgi:putative addiction module component (TIGR02574 family)